MNYALILMAWLGVLSLLGARAGPICAVAPSNACPSPSPSSYKVPYGNAYWNIPVCQLGRWARSDDYRDRFWFYSHKGSATDQSYNGEIMFHFGSKTVSTTNPDPADFSVPAYDMRKNNTVRRARSHTMGNGVGTNIPANETFPWNTTWKTCEGSDYQMLLLNPDTGMEIDIWYIDWVLGAFNCLNIFDPFNSDTDICAGQIWVLKDMNGSVADYRTYEGVAYGGSAAGTPGFAGLVTAEEVRAGEIRHALGAFTYNTMFGPPCSDEDMLDPNKAGVTCGFVMLPGAQFEFRNAGITVCEDFRGDNATKRRQFLPEGIRFAIDITDAQIEAFLDSKNYTGPKRSTARILAKALKNYGFMILGTTCWNTAVFTDGNQNADTQAIWKSLGIDPTVDPTVNMILKGLFTREQVYVVAPPVSVQGGNKWYITNVTSKHEKLYTSNHDCPSSSVITTSSSTSGFDTLLEGAFSRLVPLILASLASMYVFQ